MSEDINSTIEKHSQAVVNQLKLDFSLSGDKEVYVLSPTLPYRTDEMICTDLVITKIVETLSNVNIANQYALMMAINSIFSLENREEYIKKVLKNLNILKSQYEFTSSNEFVEKLKADILDGNLCYIIVDTRNLSYHINYKTNNTEERTHEVIISGYNHEKECFIGYDNSVSYSLKLFDELAGLSVYFRLYFSKDDIKKMGYIRKSESFYICSLKKGSIQEEISESLNVTELFEGINIRSCLKEILVKFASGTNYRIEFLKMISVGSWRILHEKLEKMYSAFLDPDFSTLLIEGENLRNRIFNKILKYKFVSEEKRELLKPALLKMGNEVERIDKEVWIRLVTIMFDKEQIDYKRS